MSFYLRLFGGITLEGPLGAISGGAAQQRPLAVLALLATAHPHGCTRDKLVGYLWPESDQGKARHRLADVLHLIRRSLGDDAIVLAGDNVRLNHAAVESDVAAFLDALESGDLEPAARHYRGPFLDGFALSAAPEFERWLESQRQRLGERYAAALQTLTARAKARGDYVAAAQWWRQLLLHDPYNSRFALGLIEALARSGDPANAWLTLHEHERLLREDLEVEPAADFRRRAEELIRAPVERAVSRAPEEIIATAERDSQSVAAGAVRPSAIRGRKRRAVIVVASLLTLAGAILAVRAIVAQRALDPGRVLVVAFVKESGAGESPALGRIAQDYVIQVLTEAGFAEVVDPLTTLAVSQNGAAGETRHRGPDLRTLAADARAGTVVSGAYYAEGDSLAIVARISDARHGKLLETVGPFVGTRGSDRQLVERLGRKVVAALASVLNREVGTLEPAVQPALYDAYAPYADGLNAYVVGDWERAARDFERAVAADSTFARARLWAAQVLVILSRDKGDDAMYAKADSLIAPLVATREQLSRYDRCQLDLVLAFGTRASLSAAYEAARCMVLVAPGSDQASLELAHAARRLNRPGEAIAILQAHDPDHGLYKRFAGYQALLRSLYHQLGDHQSELRVAREWRRQYPGPSSDDPGFLDALRGENMALAALGRLDELAANLRVLRSLPLKEGVLGPAVFSAALELRNHGHRDAARKIFDEEIARLQGQPDEARQNLAGVLYDAERWDASRRAFETQAARYPDDPWPRIILGKLAARRGDRDEALRVSTWLASLRHPVAERDYLVARAEIAALLGNREEAVALLRQGLEQGANWGFGPCWPRGDIDFDSLRDYPAFQELLKPKG